MSVQLIVYPQSYDGSFNAISGSSTEFIVNGISFNNLNSSGTYTSTATNPYTDTLINAAPTVLNTWYRFTKGASIPTVDAGNIVIVSAVGVNASGVYMRMSNLTVGQNYTITINLSTTGGGSIVTQYANGSNVYAGGNSAASSSQITDTFTAASTSDTVMIAYVNTSVDVIAISSASVQPVSGSIASGAIQLLGNGQTIVDLYEDEDLPLTLSVDNFKNVAEKVQSYSKAFDLPATKRNNKIFNSLFEITRSDDGVIFNVYKKTQCVLKQDGFILFEGYLRLLDVVEKDGEISYSVNLYSEVIALADFLKDSDFRALDFTELTHPYNKTEIINSWNDSGTGIAYTNPSTSGFRNAYNTVKYPFVNWNNNIPISDGTNGTAGNPELLSLEQAFRPWINVKYLIDRIFEGTPFTYESEFFDTADFQKLFMDFNWGADNTPTNVAGSTYAAQAPSAATVWLLPYATSTFSNLQLANYQSNAWQTPPNYNQTTNVLTATQLNETYIIDYEFAIGAGSSPPIDLAFQWLHTSGGTTTIIDATSFTTASTAAYNWVGNFTIVMDVGDTLEAQFKSNGSYTFQYSRGAADVFFFKSISATTSDSILQTLRGETGQWDFLKGLITMFNLMTIPDKDNPNNIKIEPYGDIFGSTGDGVELNWTDKIDTSEMKLTPLADLNRKTIFKFEEDEDDFTFMNYKNQVGGHLYGSEKYNADNEFNILEGTNEVVAEPFASTVVKPLLLPQYPSFIIPSIYAYNTETQLSEGFENSPRIMYNNGIVDSVTTYYIPEQNGVASTNAETDYLKFSHLSESPTTVDTLDFNFGICQLLTNQSATPNNLFNLYWLPYYAELYNPNTRIMTIKVNLSPADLSGFKFNDTIFIKNRIFRVNKIDYKPNDLATVEFILIP